MRILLAAAAAFSLIATASAADADNCAQTRSKKIAFGEGRSVIVTASSIPGPVAPEGGGDNCRLATVVLTVHNEDGSSVATYAAPAIAASYDLGHTEEPVPAAKLGAFLDSWINVEITTADKAPSLDTDGLTAEPQPEDYEAIRQSKAPMLCFPKNAFETTCYAPDSSGYIIELFTREQT